MLVNERYSDIVGGDRTRYRHDGSLRFSGRDPRRCHMLFLVNADAGTGRYYLCLSGFGIGSDLAEGIDYTGDSVMFAGVVCRGNDDATGPVRSVSNTSNGWLMEVSHPPGR